MQQSLDVGGVLSRVFGLYTKHLTTLLVIGAIIFIPLGIIEGLLRYDTGIVLGLVGSIVSLVGTYLFVGTVVRLVQDVQDGKLDASVGELFSSIMPVLFTLIIVGILASIATGIGLVLCIVPGLFLLTFWAVVSPAVVVENAGIGQAFSRSWELVKGNAWQVFAVILLFFIIQFAASFLLGLLLIAVSDSVIMTIIAAIVGHLLVAPLSALAAAVIYFDLVAIKNNTAVPAVADPAYPPPPPPAAADPAYPPPPPAAPPAPPAAPPSI